MATKYKNLASRQKHISIELDSIIKKLQRSLQNKMDFEYGKKSPDISYKYASRHLARQINGGVKL